MPTVVTEAMKLFSVNYHSLALDLFILG